MLGCYYMSLGAVAFGWTQMVPAIVTLGLFLMSAATQESFYFFYAWFLYIPQYIVWVFQYYFQSIRPDPVCQLYHTWAFPSTESMYLGSIVGVFVAYTYVKQVDQGWVNWLVIYMVGLFPPVILVYTQYNRWWEVTFSLAFGFLSSILFVAIVWLFIRPKIKYLHYHFPLSLLQYSEAMCDEKVDSRILQALERVSRIKY